jgi:hypothetical protein
LDAIVTELANGSVLESQLSGNIGRLLAKFDFAAVMQLAALLQNKKDSRAAN